MPGAVETYGRVHATGAALERNDRLDAVGIAEADAAPGPGIDASAKDPPTMGILAALSDPSARRDG